MQRRRFVLTSLAGAFAASFVAEAQQSRKVDHPQRDGRNFGIVYRSSDGHYERFSALASEPVRLSVDLIVTRGPQTAKTLGLTVRRSLLLRADQVIE
jgi:hypothetical protein